jgi:hypothetical protein
MPQALASLCRCTIKPFRLGFEPFREPMERFEAALSKTPERTALREIGETFVLPP